MRTSLRMASMAVLAIGLMTGLGAAAMAAGPAAGHTSIVRSETASGIEKADYYYGRRHYYHRPYYGWHRPYYRPYVYAPPPVVYRPAPYYYSPYYYAPTYYYPY